MKTRFKTYCNDPETIKAMNEFNTEFIGNDPDEKGQEQFFDTMESMFGDNFTPVHIDVESDVVTCEFKVRCKYI